MKGLDAQMLENEAEQALWELLPRWDPARRPLRTFAAARIVGALKDCGRQADHVTRLMRLRLKDGAPRTWHMSALTLDEGRESPASWTDPKGGRDLDVLLAKDQVAALKEKMPARLWRVLELHFLQGLTLKAVGKRMRRSESRASQLVVEALAKARLAQYRRSSSRPAPAGPSS